MPGPMMPQSAPPQAGPPPAPQAVSDEQKEYQEYLQYLKETGHNTPSAQQPADRQAQAAGGTKPLIQSAIENAKNAYSYLDQKMGQNDQQAKSAIDRAQQHPLPNTDMINELGVGAPGSGLASLLGRGVKAIGGPALSMGAKILAPGLSRAAKGVEGLSKLLGTASEAAPVAESGIAEAAPIAKEAGAAIVKKPWDFSQLPIQKR